MGHEIINLSGFCDFDLLKFNSDYTFSENLTYDYRTEEGFFRIFLGLFYFLQ